MPLLTRRPSAHPHHRGAHDVTGQALGALCSAPRSVGAVLLNADLQHVFPSAAQASVTSWCLPATCPSQYAARRIPLHAPC